MGSESQYADKMAVPPYPVVNEKMEEEEEEDPWALTETIIPQKSWSELSTAGKFKRVLWEYIGRFVLLLGLLYMFICSIDLLSSAFKALGGKAAGQIFTNSEILSNPICGLMIGVLVTVLVQSSSTSTAIVVTMVSAGILKVSQAVYIVMGANIGTSVTNTLVSMGHTGRKNEFRRAFAGATVHDMFNWLSVLVILPIEVASGFLTKLTDVIMDHAHQTSGSNQKFLKVITEPFTKLIIQIDSKVIEDAAKGEAICPVVKRFCKGLVCHNPENSTAVNVTKERCQALFSQVDWPDAVIGGVLLVFSLLILTMCLLLIVKLLQAMLKGKVALVIKKVINANFPGYLSWLTGYVAILIGAGMTILVQSSSIFTSTLTPLVGIGMVSLERMYPLTLGSNIGTTCTSVLAALATSGDSFRNSMQIAMCHLFFNLVGIILWYPVPFMRKVPIKLAKGLGNITADYRWFAIFYIILIFFALPAIVFALSVIGWYVLAAVGIPVVLIIIFVIIVNILQKKRPQMLPETLRTWMWLPEPLRSLAPLDRMFGACFFCKCCDNICYRPGTERDKALSMVAKNGGLTEVTTVSGRSNDFASSMQNGEYINPAFEHDMPQQSSQMAYPAPSIVTKF